MSTITLDEIKAEQTKLAKMIATFEAQAEAETEFLFPETRIVLRPGEAYAGIIISDDESTASHHLILLPDEGNDLNWEEAKAWAKEIGGELPTLREQPLLFANLKEHFKGAYYWSCEQHENKAYAWAQYFCYGGQSYLHTDGKLRARAVRRLIIE